MSVDSPAAGAADASAASDKDGFLTREQLADAARFSWDEKTLEVPELGGKLGIRGLSVAEQNQLDNQIPDDLAKWTLKHTALSFSKFVVKPEMTEAQWLEVIKPMPNKALLRINRALNGLIGLRDEEDNAAALEFPGSED